MDGAVFTKVWIIRLGISLVLTAVTAWGVSFWIADYVVKANTISIEQTLAAVLQANNATAAGNENSIAGIVNALETLNSTLTETNRAVGGLRDELTFLAGMQKDSSGAIALLQADVERISKSISEAGIKVDFTADLQRLFSPKNEGWDSVRAEFGITDEQPIFLKIEPQGD
jgi:hypothetical protein